MTDYINNNHTGQTFGSYMFSPFLYLATYNPPTNLQWFDHFHSKAIIYHYSTGPSKGSIDSIAFFFCPQIIQEVWHREA